MTGIKHISITSAQSVKKITSAQTWSMVFSLNKVQVREVKTHKKRSITCALTFSRSNVFSSEVDFIWYKTYYI